MEQVLTSFRLSPQQAHLWRQSDTTTPYISGAILIEGEVNVVTLQEAIHQVASRHDIYRTSFQRMAGMNIPTQVIHEKPSITWSQIDLRGVDPKILDRQIEFMLRQERQSSVDFEQDPGIYVSFIKLSQQKQVLIVRLLMLNADYQTLQNFVKELASYYGGASDSADLSEEIVQYIQYSEWHNALLEEEAGEESWQQDELLALSSLSLFCESNAEHLGGFVPAMVMLPVNKTLQAGIEALTEHYNSSIPHVLLACWAVLLWRLTGKQKLLIGWEVDGRVFEELAQGAGPFSSYVPLICQLTEKQDFLQVLAHLNTSTQESYERQHNGFWLNKKSTKGPLFPFGFDWRNLGIQYAVDGVCFSLDRYSAHQEPFKIRISVIQKQSELRIEFHYNASLFSVEDICRLKDQFCKLMAGIVEQPKICVSDIDFLSDNERQTLMAFNNTNVSYPRDVCVHLLFERQAYIVPDKIAVAYGDQQLTYQALDRYATQLACHLQSAGIGPEIPVGIYMERSIELLIAVIGILKSGGAYIPLDPAYPKERLEFIITDARVPLVLTQSHLTSLLPATIPQFCLDTSRSIPTGVHREMVPTRNVRAHNLAYVIYTSGSTGIPKGVMVTHQGVVNYLLWSSQYYEVSTGTGSVVHSPLVFDLTVTSLFCPLIVGQRVVLLAEKPGIEALGQTLRGANDFSLVKVTPAHLAVLSRTLPVQEGPRSTRVLVIGGEALHSESIQWWQDHAPGTRLINEYGPTETVVGCCIYEVPVYDAPSGAVPIGKPIANTQLYVLDQSLRPTPLGVPGELYIGGEGLARGYLNRPDLTAASFVPNPFSSQQGARLYKTGDVVRFLPSGLLEYQGRTDHQAKLRGYRIELGEIESVLSQYPGVSEAVVQVREDNSDDKRLVAYIVPGPSEKPSLDELRHFLQEKLPDYMVPTTFVKLEKLPLTLNGKVDRQALPAPEEIESKTLQRRPSSLSPVEEILTTVWNAVLRKEQVGLYDNFFELGGHSLLAMKVISQIQTLLGVSLPISSLFEAPTIWTLAQKITQLQQEHLGMHLPPITPVVRDEKLPLSFAQQRLWFLDQLEPGNPAYNISGGLHLSGSLNVDALAHSLQEILRRHESLHTTFVLLDGAPVQRIAPLMAKPLTLVDLTSLPACDQEKVIQSLAQAEAIYRFDLSQGPLLRTTLLRLSEQEHVFLLTVHHIVFDGWSTEIFLREVSQLYAAFATGHSSPLPDLALQYADVAHWQRTWLQGELLNRQLDYWKQQLAGSPALLELPTDAPRPAIQSYHGAVLTHILPPTLTQQLKALSQQEQVSLFMLLEAAFAVLLSRYSRQEDILIGTPIANRNYQELEAVIGFFVNTLVLRNDLSENPTFQQLLERVRTIALAAYTHQDLPFERLVDELELERTLRHSPLFQVMFTLQNAAESMHGGISAALTIQSLELESRVTKFDLMLSLQEGEAGLYSRWQYRVDLFHEQTITRMAEQFQILLEEIVARPDQRVADVDLLTDKERQLLLVQWNATGAEYVQDTCLHHLIEMQVKHTPDAIAVVFEDQQFTYLDLNRRANQLAHHLQAQGVGPETVVGICLERSLELVVGLLGILKAGGAYMPLAPTHPLNRLTFMLRDAQAPLLLTQEPLWERQPDIRAVYLDADREGIAQRDSENPQSGVNGSNIAYVIYTSGSTGQPKGVMNTHRGICNRLFWMQEAYGLDTTDRVMQKTPFSFDVSVWEFFWPLLTGARLVVTRPEGHRDSTYLAELIARQQVTTLHFVPSMLQVFLEEPDLATTCSSLRRVICSGEALPYELQERFLARLDVELHNLYGPTEAAVDVTSWACQQASHYSLVPIGRPIANIQIYILDQHLRPTPIGVPGELHIGGVGVARGYLNRPDLTAQRFIPDPFSLDAGMRLYKTGDLARYLPDGNIEFLERIDDQVKIRGYRIELGEIQAALAQHPSVRECAVLVRENTAADKRLVAYLVAPKLGNIATDLRRYLQNLLPDYMIPTDFVFLDRLPLTANGKLDKRALPVPERGRADLEQKYVAPRTTVEEALVAIWANALGIEHVGIDDNFFALGGDSIRSVRVLALMKERGFSCTLQHLFQYQTIRELAHCLQTQQFRAPEQSQTGPFSLISEADRAKLPETVEDAYPLTMLQLGMLYHMELTADRPMYHNVLSFHVRMQLDEAILQQAVQLVVMRHPILRTSFDLTRYSEPLQLVHQQALLPLYTEDLRTLSFSEQEQAIDAFVLREKAQLFDLAHPPLLRLAVHRRTDESVQITITEAHPILDGWSYHLIIVEIFRNHQALLTQEPVEQAPLTSTFRDYVGLERLALRSKEQRDYWLNLLSESSFLGLPRLKAGAETHAPKIEDYEIAIPQQISLGLQQVARAAAVPLKSVLLAAHLKLLSVISGEVDIVTGLVGNGRLEEADGEQVRGLFLNTTPFRLRIEEETWLELIHKVFQAERASLPFRRYPMQALQQAMDGKPLFETSFNYVHFHSMLDLFDTVAMEGLSPVKAMEETNFVFTSAFSVSPGSSQINLLLEIDTSVISEQQIQAMVSYYTRILDAIATTPELAHDASDIVAPEEAHQCLVTWNDTSKPLPELAGVHQYIEAQVQRTPQAPALIFEGQALSYRQLNERANQLAHRLQQCGVGPEVLVGVYMERCLEQVISLLAILKAGGAYLPLEPSYPPERVSYMLQDSATGIVLTLESWRQQLSAYRGQLLCVDSDTSLPRQSRDNLPWRGTGANAMYLLYTSGSTGQPKGALNTHQALCNRLHWMQQTYQLTPADRVMQKTPFSFDVSGWEFFWPLQCGASLVIVRPGGHQDPFYLADLIREQQVTTLHFVPSMLQVFLQHPEIQQRCGSLRRVICSGEALSWELQQQFFARFAGSLVQLENLYGPTEAAIDVTFWSCQPGEERAIVPIGRPITNTQIYLLDRRMRPVPVGVPGEIYIGGVGLARGYHRRSDLTAERFVPSPFGPQPGARLYKTGDQARYRADGAIEYLGRLDNQIKLRGMRIELGEIESVLREHPAIQDAVVIVQQDEYTEPHLVAYLVAAGPDLLEQNAVRAFVQKRLPAHMVPTFFMILERLPLTPNGKLDRNKLLALELPQTVDEATFVGPTTPIEQQLAAIWSKLLGVERISIHDDFFALGGHSLLATRLVFQLREILQREIPFRLLFKNSTLAAMAQAINLLQAGENPDVIPAAHNRWYEDAVLDATIRIDRLPPLLPRAITHPGAVFLTGATGFLGTALLYELLQQTRATIYCLVRGCATYEAALQKIERQLLAYAADQAIEYARIVPVLGDLSLPLFGLAPAHFDLLAEQIDQIYHNGAEVKAFAPYQALKLANVGGTQEVLRLACRKKVKLLHYISTTSVVELDNSFGKQAILENHPLDDFRAGLERREGYPQTKWVAEKLITQAREQGLPVCIYRPGRISGHSQSGLWRDDDLFVRWMLGIIQVGSVPGLEGDVNLIPVDYLSRALIALSLQPQSLGKNFHLLNPVYTTAEEIFKSITSFGYSVRMVPYEQWYNESIEKTQSVPELPLTPLLGWFANPALQKEQSASLPEPGKIFDCSNVIEGLKDTPIRFPAISEQMIHSYLSYFVQKNVLIPPKR